MQAENAAKNTGYGNNLNNAYKRELISKNYKLI